MFLVTAKEMQDMDRTTIESFGIPGRVLMENAGRGGNGFFPGIDIPSPPRPGRGDGGSR